jgi:hypothetical protein
MAHCSVPISIGELLDKITILEIKAERIDEPAKVANVRVELDLLRDTWSALSVDHPELPVLVARLRTVNEALWEIEDEIRDEERRGEFGERFIQLARSVYVSNDERAALKREINRLTGSALVEEKSYREYRSDEP